MPFPLTKPVEPHFLEPRLHFDAAFVGWGQRPGDPCPIALYDYERCLNATMTWLECDRHAAIDYVERDVEGSWVGPGTPMIINLCPLRVFEDIQACYGPDQPLAA